MSVSKISNRYAKSLIDLAAKNNRLEEVVGDVKAFLELAKDRDFYLFLKSPIIKAERKAKVFEALFNSKENKELKSFFNLVLKKERENMLVEIMQAVLYKYKEMQGITTVVLTSAEALSDSEFAKIQQKLQKAGLTNNNVEFIKKVDPSIIGGFIIEIGDKLYDASVSAKLKKIRKELVEN